MSEIIQQIRTSPALVGKYYRGRPLASAAMILLVTACAAPGPVQEDTPHGRQQQAVVRQVQSEDVQELLAEANRSTPERAAALTLQAAQLALEGGNAEQSARILELVDLTADPDLLRDYIYLRSRIALALGDHGLALRLLSDQRLLSLPLTNEDQITLAKIRAGAYAHGRSYLASARERIFMHSLLPMGEREENHEHIFATLLELPADTLESQAEKAITSDLRGWLSLAAMTRRYQDDPLQQLIELNRWKKIWGHHPAAAQLPASLQLLSRIVEQQPRSIALLLPLHGDLGPFGRAIRDGILAAHYSVSGKTRIHVYDTSTGNISALLGQAKRDGAELALGPLDRSNVTQLARSGALPMPVLALNRTLEGSVNPDLYQFGLAPEDEVIQVAEQAFRGGKRNVLVLYSAGDWGERNFDTFSQRWLGLGGNIVDVAQYDNQRDYSDLIKGLLDVDESESRAAELRRITGQRFEFTPRRRQDIDFVFLLANPIQARRINPTLSFYYAEDIPVYATSHVYEYSDSRIEAIDLNGIRFCDIPWKLAKPDQLQRQVQQTWATSQTSLAAFYALGIDAYRLYPRLQQLKELDDARLYGTTGVLRLDETNVINRELMWAQFRDGEATSVPMILESTGG